MTTVCIMQMDELIEAVKSSGGVPPAEASRLAEDASRYGFNAAAAEGGRCVLADRAMNLVEADGGVLELALPPPVEGKARDLVAKIRAGAETELSVSGAEFEGDDPDAFAPVPAGGCAVLCLTETEPGVFMAARKTLERVNHNRPTEN